MVNQPPPDGMLPHGWWDGLSEATLPTTKTLPGPLGTLRGVRPPAPHDFQYPTQVHGPTTHKPGTPGTPAPKPAPKPTPKPSMSHDQQSAYDLMQATLQSWGISTLGDDVRKLILAGDTSPDTLALALSQTDAYKQRFAANAARAKAGLPQLTPAQYIATEEQYRNSLARYGLPHGFYNDKASTDNWIAGDVSPAEVDARAQDAAALVYDSPKEALQAWHDYFGGGLSDPTGHAIAAVLDHSVAEPLIQQRIGAAQIGGAALQQGLHTSAENALHFAQGGTTLAQAQQAYSAIAGRLGTDAQLSNRFGQTFGQQQEENATLGHDAAALNQQQALYAQEGALFGGHGGGTAATGNAGSNY